MSTRAQRFSAKTAEEAVLAAIDALGEDAEVVDARRVKRPGFAGMFGGEAVVVTARPRVGARSGAVAARAAAPPSAPTRSKRQAKVDARQAELDRRRAQKAQQAASKAAAKAASSRRFRKSLRAALDDQGPVGPDDDWTDELGLGIDDDTDWVDDEAVLDLTDTPAGSPPRGSARMLDLRDDDFGDGGGRGPASHAQQSRLPSRFTADDLVPLPDPPPGASPRAARALLTLAPAPPVPAGIAVAANPAVIDLRSHARQRARAASLAPPPPPPPPQQPQPEPTRSVVDLVGKGDGAVRWGRAELRSIGVPEPVLAYLPATDPISDTVWSMTLETAIWWTLRKHRSRTNLVVDGYGPEGAMALLEAVLEGHVIRYLHLGDRSVDATPAELAKAVRSCLPR